MADIIGTENNEVLTGTDGDDTLTSLTGYDTLDGGEGSDTYIIHADDYNGRYVDFYNDTGTQGTDVIQAAVAGIDIGLGSGFSAASGIEKIDGLDGSRITGNNDNEIWDFTGVNLTGIDWINAQGGHDNITGNEQNNRIDGGEGHDVIDGGAGNDEILGGSGNDILTGGAGNDRLDGGAGYDYLDGGEGSDIYYVGLDNGAFVDEYNDTGTTGRDRIFATEADTVIGLQTGFGPDNGIEVISSRGNDNVTIGGNDESQTWDFSQTILGGIQWINALGGHDNVTGNDRNNRIDAGEGHDVVDGGAGNDHILGGAGNDILTGGTGRDRLDGGAGYDYLDGGEGSDIYYVGLDNGAFVDEYNDTGTEGRDRIVATEADTVIGLQTGFGPDNGIEVISAGGQDNVTIGGNDESQTWDFSQTILAGIRWINALGGNDVVTGNDRNNRIDGGEGHDVVDGGAGNDQILGGTGNDILTGGTGRDRLDGGAGYDYLDGGEGSDIYYVGLDNAGFVDEYNDTGTEGRDRILATEADTVIGLQTGFGPDNGIEVISSRGHDNVTIGGNDASQIWDFSQTILAGITEINAGGGNDVVVGSSRKDVINGGDDHDQLFGEVGNDTLNGGSGNDILNGGQGRDTLTGGEGFDIFAFGPNSGRDTITDFSLAGDLIDLTGFDGALTYDDLEFVQGSTGLLIKMGDEQVLLENVLLDSLSEDSFIFPQIDEDVTINGGNDSDILEGGSGNDTIYGSHGDDTLSGHNGQDYLDGGNGNDVLNGGNGNDELIGSHGNDELSGGAGDDTLDGGNNEDILSGGEGNDTLIGFNGRDILSGGAGEDKLDGGNDDDQLDGGDGNDVLIGFNGRDTLLGGAGEDTLDGGNDDDVLDGGAGNDTLIGFNGRDTLIGGDGDDILIGNTDSDILTGGNGNDTFVFEQGSGRDVVTDFTAGEDLLDFSGFGEEVSFEALNITQAGNDVLIEYQGSHVTLEDANIDAIVEDFFIF